MKRTKKGVKSGCFKFFPLFARQSNEDGAAFECVRFVWTGRIAVALFGRNYHFNNRMHASPLRSEKRWIYQKKRQKSDADCNYPFLSRLPVYLIIVKTSNLIFKEVRPPYMRLMYDFSKHFPSKEGPFLFVWTFTTTEMSNSKILISRRNLERPPKNKWKRFLREIKSSSSRSACIFLTSGKIWINNSKRKSLRKSSKVITI